MEENQQQLKVSNIISEVPISWNIQKMQEVFDKENIQEIRRISLPSFSRSHDKVFWTPSNSGEFIVKTAYKMIINNQEETQQVHSSNFFKGI